MVEPLKELWQIDIKGDFDRKLESLRKEIDAAQGSWGKLKREFGDAAEFKRSASAMAALKGEARDLAKEWDSALSSQVRIADEAGSLGNALSSLSRETNKLNASRLKELTILRQTKANQDPLVIQLRAEASALRRLTGLLQEEGEKRRFAALAKEAGLKLSADGTRVFNAEADALARIAKEAEKAAVAEELRKRGFDAVGKPLPAPAVAKTPQQKAETVVASELERLSQKNLETQLKLNNSQYVAAARKKVELAQKMRELTEGVRTADGVFSQFAFTFRRLVGVMAVFTVARVVTREFSNMVKGAIQFQAEIESTRVGLAGLVAASAEIRSPDGNALGIDEQLLRSQQIAIDQMNKLRVDALATAASYNEIAAAFQNAVAPGLQANLTLDQIRKVTVNISQAATGLGLAQDQLAEEIRSLFTGAISARNTRIATALGITPADIARAKQAGQLFEFLDQRFAAIAKTGKLLMNTFTGQLSNAADAFKQLLAVSSTPLFEQLKGALQDFQKGIFSTVGDAVKLDPQTVSAFRALFQGLSQGVAAVRAAFSRLDFGGLADALGLVGQVLATAAGAIANAFVAFTNAAAPTLTVFRLLLGVVNSVLAVVKLLPEPVRALFGFVGGTSLKALLLAVTLKKVLPILSGMVTLWGKIQKSIIVSVAVSSRMSAPLRLANSFLQLIVVNCKNILRFAGPVLGILAGIDAVLSAVGVKGGLFENVSDAVGSLTEKLFGAITGVKGLKEELSGEAKSPFGIPINDFRQLRGELAEVGIEIQNGIRAAAQELKRSVQALGLPGTIASQIAKSAQTQDNAKNSPAYLQAERAVNQLERQLEELRKRAESTNRSVIESRLEEENQKAEQLQKTMEVVYRSMLSEFGGNAERLSARFRFLKQLSDGGAAVNRSRKREGALSSEEAEFFKLREQAKETNKEIISLRETFRAIFAPIDTAVSQIDILKNKMKEIAELARIQAFIQESGDALIDGFDTSIRSASLESEITEAASRAAAVGSINVLAAEAAQKRAAAERQAVSAIQNQVSLLRGIEVLRGRIDESFNTLTTTDDPAVAEAADKQIVALQLQVKEREKELDLVKQLNAEQAKLAARETRLAELRATGTSGQGVLFGLQQFAAENSSMFDMGAQFAKGALEGFASLGGQAIGALFDPNSNLDLREATGQLALQLGTNLATQMIENLAARAIEGLGIDLGFDAAASLATETLKKSAADKLQESGLLWAANATALNAVADKLLKAGALQTGASVTGALSGTGTARGGKINMHTPRVRSSLRHHVGAPGFAGGGYLGKDSRDTIPAWLRPGEWVIRPEAVATYGDRLFHLLNRRELNPSALAGIAAAARSKGGAPRTAGKRIGYATGGKVASAGAAVAQPVIVANYHDEQTMERSLAAGPGAQIRFARTKRAQMLASLGLTPGG